MIRFTLGGEKQEFDDDDMSNLEVLAVKKVTGYSYNEFWQAFADSDGEAVTAFVWLHRRRQGETDLKFTDVEFNFMEFGQSLESDAAEETDAEADPTPDDEPGTPSS